MAEEEAEGSGANPEVDKLFGGTKRKSISKPVCPRVAEAADKSELSVFLDEELQDHRNRDVSVAVKA